MNFVKVDILVTFHHTGMGSDVHTKIILTFLFLQNYTIFIEDGLVSGFDGNTKYIVCSLFPDPQPKLNWVSKVC